MCVSDDSIRFSIYDDDDDYSAVYLDNRTKTSASPLKQNQAHHAGTRSTRGQTINQTLIANIFYRQGPKHRMRQKSITSKGHEPIRQQTKRNLLTNI